jgi:excinuclease ABC subunit C
MAELPEKVQEKLKQVPAKPGCYLYYGEKGDVLYVGKAVNLRSRVRSYFQKSAKHAPRTAKLVQNVCDIQWMVVDSELEALVLECNLIKEHRPRYNVMMRDDKSYPYIVITNEKYPRVLFTRRPRRGGGTYFGPYTSAWAVRETLDLLHKIFPLIPCGKSWSGRDEQRPCLYYHLGQCLAPCAGLSPKAEYDKVIEEVKAFLRGRQEDVQDQLRHKMQEAAERMDFEQAATYRDQINAVQRVLERQKVMSEDDRDRDVIAVVKDERGASIQMLYVRHGRLIGQKNFMLSGAKQSAATEAIESFVKQYYSDAPEIPKEILLPVEITEREIVQKWLRGRRGEAVKLEVPKGGEKLKMVNMAAENAELALQSMVLEMEQKERWAEQAATQLYEELDLPAVPMRVEGYDISNIQGKAPVGSMVVFEDGQAAKGEYRRFKIRYHPEDPNDFAMMHEVITRRLRKYLEKDEKFAKLPDLIMIDGGKGQLMAALKARDELGLTVPMIGLAKRLELIYLPQEIGKGEPTETELVPARPESPLPEAAELQRDDSDDPPLPRKDDYDYRREATKRYEYQEVVLDLAAPGLMLLRKLRDEAHRFAVSYHRKLRDKRVHGSLLDEIPGIGPKRRRMLLRTFGSVEGIRRATIDEIAAVPTLTRTQAQQINEYLRQD